MPAIRTVILAAVAAVSIVAAAKTETPLDSIRQDLTVLEKLIKNTAARLEHVAGADTGSSLLRSRSEAQTVKNPIAGCCSKNIQAIDGRLKSVVASLRELDALHVAAGDGEGQESLSHMAGTLREVVRSHAGLAQASEKRGAQLALKMLVGHFNHLRRDADEYEECCAAALVEPSKPEKKRKKRADRD